MTTSVLIRPGLPLLGQRRKHEGHSEEGAPAPQWKYVKTKCGTATVKVAGSGGISRS